jgi:hypothetical protein
MKQRIGDMRKAIADKCLDCSGNSKKEVNMCPITDCPLFPFRLIKFKRTGISKQVYFKTRNKTKKT